MSESKKRNAQYSFAINSKLRSDFLSKAKKRGESGVDLLNKCVEAYMHAEEPQPVDCPICASTLLVEAGEVHVIKATGDHESVKVPIGMRDLVEEFVKFAVAPEREDVTLNEVVIGIFRQRILSRNQK